MVFWLLLDWCCVCFGWWVFCGGLWVRSSFGYCVVWGFWCWVIVGCCWDWVIGFCFDFFEDSLWICLVWKLLVYWFCFWCNCVCSGLCCWVLLFLLFGWGCVSWLNWDVVCCLVDWCCWCRCFWWVCSFWGFGFWCDFGMCGIFLWVLVWYCIVYILVSWCFGCWWVCWVMLNIRLVLCWRNWFCGVWWFFRIVWWCCCCDSFVVYLVLYVCCVRMVLGWLLVWYWYGIVVVCRIWFFLGLFWCWWFVWCFRYWLFCCCVGELWFLVILWCCLYRSRMICCWFWNVVGLVVNCWIYVILYCWNCGLWCGVEWCCVCLCVCVIVCICDVVLCVW